MENRIKRVGQPTLFFELFFKNKGVFMMNEVIEIANQIAAALNYEIVKIFFKREYGRKILSVTLNKDGGVTIKDCEVFSKRLSLALDEADVIKEKYYLEVASPGI